ncbi:Hypothetical predicted protein [Mytilus galloprovincialis]|uniref:C-type lectin domain-containing protein n=1 Tax=Mytilus galloprovincialis TaxID=29158 RepID=A0A8B6FIY5_MYTGA|nr:Hypothetical predicted protein [Mytilus galloprovincialis]
MTTDDATTAEGQTSKQIDTSFQECDIGWLMLGTGCYQFTLGGSRQMWLDAKVKCFKFTLGGSRLMWLDVKVRRYQFTLVNTRQMWLDAKDICSFNGGYLAIIETTEENVLIKDHVAVIGPTNDYFIGGSDLATEGEFIWEHSGLPVNLPGSNLFHDWRTNQPDNKNGNQHCIMLGYQVSFNWNDAQCAYARDFICEKSPVYY